jgi:hypothetical protein
MRLFATTVLAVALSTVSASASGPLKPGQWNFYYQPICLVSDGTAYFPAYGGHDQTLWWVTNSPNPNVKNIIYGTIADSAYFETIEVSRRNTINWFEEDIPTHGAGFYENLPITFVKRTCDPPMASVHGFTPVPATAH